MPTQAKPVTRKPFHEDRYDDPIIDLVAAILAPPQPKPEPDWFARQRQLDSEFHAQAAAKKALEALVLRDVDPELLDDLYCDAPLNCIHVPSIGKVIDDMEAASQAYGRQPSEAAQEQLHAARRSAEGMIDAFVAAEVKRILEAIQ